MTYEELIKELCDVIRESEEHSSIFYDNLEAIDLILDNQNIPEDELNKARENISNSIELLQHQDFHRQKIERVVNHVLVEHNIDPTEYNIAPSAKTIVGDEELEIVSDEELDALIKSMT